ncbi:tyrosine-type recombinase/integrase (plasmid) [Pseudomonas aeruginosa]|uniref:tyrosine-type recombinase/integrase n=1 Tax=Pseudomonas aeruginosa TaxID=287 RepID=UPI0023641882|nr:site-specific integrase [Pseudomonas aeruginosa]
MREITSVDIATYRDERLQQLNGKTGQQISPATVRLEMSLLSNLFELGRIEWGICDDNPVLKVRKPKMPPGRERRLTSREERLILRYAHNYGNSELYAIIIVALETAMRQGEILNLSWEHINLKTRIAHLPDTKNGTRRDVPLSIKARDALIQLGVAGNGRVFSLHERRTQDHMASHAAPAWN